MKLFTTFTLLLALTLSTLFAQKVDEMSSDESKNKISSTSGNNETKAAGDKIYFHDGATILLEIENIDNNAGGIIFYDAAVSGGGFGTDLINLNGSLFWGGNQIGLAGDGISTIGDLADAIYVRNSLYLGEGSGASDNISISPLRNTGIGRMVLSNLTSGTDNVAVGNEALEKSNTIRNTAIGSGSLRWNTSGIDNTALGSYSLSNNSGSKNVALGANTLSNGTTGSRNIAIGYEAGRFENGNDKLYIENSASSTPLIYGDFTDGFEIVKINGDFHVTGNISVNDDKSISGLDNLVGYNDLKLFGSPGIIGMFISGAGNIGMGTFNPLNAKLNVVNGTNDFAGKFEATGTNSYGIHAKAPTSGWAGYFDGNASVSSRLFIGPAPKSPSSSLHIKQQNSTSAITLEYPGDVFTNSWEIYMNSGLEFTFEYNGTVKAYID